MERGLYIAAAGMAAELARQDLLANDLANAATPGYRPDRAAQRTFGDLLLANTATGQPVGPLGTGPVVSEVRTSTIPGAIRDTGEPLDFAVEGEGFFAVQTDQGVRYTRNGRFAVDGAGRLVDAFGNAVVGRGGGAVQVGGDGKVAPQALAVFAIAEPRKEGEGLVAGAAVALPGAQVRAGALEGSGVDPARAMVDMIGSMRAFEACQKAITTIDETLGKAAGQVGGLH